MLKDANNTLNLTAADQIDPAPPQMDPAAPVTVDGGLGKARAWFIFGQALAALGALISFLGLGEKTWVVHLYTFLRSEPAVPLVTFVIWVLGTFGLWWRAKGRQKTMALMAALLPNTFARVQGALHPTVQAAVQAAIKQDVAGELPVSESRRTP